MEHMTNVMFRYFFLQNADISRIKLYYQVLLLNIIFLLTFL